MASDFVTELSRKPPAVKAALLIFVIAALFGLYYQFFYSDLKDEKQQALVQKKKLSNKKQELTKKIQDKKELERRYDELQKTIEANARALPSEAELPAFFDHLQKKAGEAGINIRKWDRQKEESFGDFFKVPVSMEVNGTFYEILKYFSLLSPRYHVSLEDDTADAPERLVTIEGLSLGNPKVRGDDIVLTAKFRASTFRQEGAPPPPRKKSGKDDDSTKTKVPGKPSAPLSPE